MKLWLKQNWFKVGIFVAVFVVVCLYYSRPISQPAGQTNNDVIQSSQTLKTAFDEAAQHSAMADIAELSCFPTSRYDCSPEGCIPNTPATYYFVDHGTESGTYFRCDTKGCDSYQIKVMFSGSFVQFIPSLGQAMFFKVASDDFQPNKGEFVDVATLGTLTIISFGKCNE